MTPTATPWARRPEKAPDEPPLFLHELKCHPHRCVWLLAVFLVFVIPTVVTATTGGPDTAEMLGYDPTDRKVFYRVSAHGESDATALFYFPLATPRPWAPVRVTDWRSKHIEGRGAYDTWMHRLAARLVPLRSVPIERVETRWTVEKTDFGGAAWYAFVRRRIRGHIVCGTARADVRVLAFRDSTVRAIGAYITPDSAHTFVVLSFIGIPYESAYEVQAPVLLSRSPVPTRSLTWIR